MNAVIAWKIFSMRVGPHMKARLGLKVNQWERFSLTLFLFLMLQSLRSLLGDELSEFLAAGEQEQNMESMQSRLLRDLRLKQRAKGVWSRVLNDQTVTRKHKAGTKKGTSSSRNGCFGHKMDRIGTLSGMGC